MRPKRRKPDGQGNAPGAAAGVLRPDPGNARLHSDENKALIRKSLEEVGAFRSIAVDGQGIVRAGNATLEQAHALGLSVRIVDAARGELIAVRRKDLKGKAAVRAALLDNRAGEVGSEWDADVLKSLSLEGLTDGILSDDELAALVGDLAAPDDFKEVGGGIEVEHICPKCGYRFSGGETAATGARPIGHARR